MKYSLLLLLTVSCASPLIAGERPEGAPLVVAVPVGTPTAVAIAAANPLAYATPAGTPARSASPRGSSTASEELKSSAKAAQMSDSDRSFDALLRRHEAQRKADAATIADLQAKLAAHEVKPEDRAARAAANAQALGAERARTRDLHRFAGALAIAGSSSLTLADAEKPGRGGEGVAEMGTAMLVGASTIAGANGDDSGSEIDCTIL